MAKSSSTKPIDTCTDVPRPHSKIERLLGMLQARTGASLEDMTEATGWQAHTVRAAMTGLGKRGFAVTRHIEGSISVWSVVRSDADAAA